MTPSAPYPLHEFMEEQREKILARCRSHSLDTAQGRPRSELLEQGLEIFFSELVDVLKRDRNSEEVDTQQSTHQQAAADHGKEYLRLGYSITEVVHSYGVICQAITGSADELHYHMTSREFRQLNLSLDVAIAEAVNAYEILQRQKARDSEVERLGFLAHELRNSLHSALLALGVIESGALGLKSQTGGVLSRNLHRMDTLIESTISEVRNRHEASVHVRRFKLAEILREVEEDTKSVAETFEVSIEYFVDEHLEVDVDRQLLITALLNLVNNAIKFTKPSTTVHVRATQSESLVFIEVEDRCGGLKAGKIEQMFTPFSQFNDDRSGLGLGLAISRRASRLNGGELGVENLPGVGCIFRIVLPMAELIPETHQE